MSNALVTVANFSTKTEPESLQIVKRFAKTVQNNSVIGVTGENGVGKRTFSNVLIDQFVGGQGFTRTEPAGRTFTEPRGKHARGWVNVLTDDGHQIRVLDKALNDDTVPDREKDGHDIIIWSDGTENLSYLFEIKRINTAGYRAQEMVLRTTPELAKSEEFQQLLLETRDFRQS